jgi:hypothetical protein
MTVSLHHLRGGHTSGTISLALLPAAFISRLRRPGVVGEGDRERVCAGFHRMVHRARPVPVGSRDRVTRLSHFNANCSVECMAGARSFGRCFEVDATYGLRALGYSFG